MKYSLRIPLPVLLSLGLLTACGGNQASDTATQPKIERVADPAALIERARVFDGGEGVRVEIVELKEEGQALLRVTGTPSDIDGMVLPHSVEDNGRRLNFITERHGRPLYTVIRNTNYNGSTEWTLYVGMSRFGGRGLSFDEEATESFDAVALYRSYEEQRDSGAIAELQRFDRASEIADSEAEFEKTRAAAAEDCGADFSASIDWSTVDDERLKSLSIESFCSGGLDALRGMCSEAPVREFASQIERYECRFGDEMALRVEGSTMHWTTSPDGKNQTQYARETLQALPTDDATLGESIALSQVRVCVDKAHKRYVVMRPENGPKPGMYYGDGKSFHHVETPSMLGSGWFFEPRFYNERHNENFRGYDLRSYSYVKVDDEENTCSVTCGTRTTELPLMPADKVAGFVSDMKVEPAPMPRRPYALARDQKGIYYFVDRSTEPGRERDFQLYVGPLGSLKPQAMKNVVSDSEGEIFSSKAGDLRFVLGRNEALWIAKRRERKLLKVPVEDNYKMIYNNLGVYFGVSLGTPCDDFGLE
ncbi:hypothetical protein [Haliangium ochraceum]|uniref:Lipoprotein n=1 Tax=Haliangium ochraceum (strain DSM 14365 / JCM 11303 / SMP-2) TaxID=502025 RepID=D0LUY9_HALO1|nr:hypothetical protein [Haliangium ochraceum]ACY15830.1 hypothetical protein Hoch_3328 [Haliangium ochraceum DSM 14365]